MAVNYSHPTNRFQKIEWLVLWLIVFSFAAFSISAQTPNPTPPPNDDDEQIGQINVHTDLVTLTLTVTDQFGRYVSGLSKSAFTISDNNEEQELTFLATAMLRFR